MKWRLRDAHDILIRFHQRISWSIDEHQKEIPVCYFLHKLCTLYSLLFLNLAFQRLYVQWKHNHVLPDVSTRSSEDNKLKFMKIAQHFQIDKCDEQNVLYQQTEG